MRRQFPVDAFELQKPKVLAFKLLTDRESAIIKLEGEPKAARDRWLKFMQISDKGIVVEEDSRGRFVSPKHGGAQHDWDEALQKSVVDACFRKLADKLGLDAAKHRDAKVFDVHHTALNAVHGVRVAPNRGLIYASATGANVARTA